MITNIRTQKTSVITNAQAGESEVRYMIVGKSIKTIQFGHTTAALIFPLFSKNLAAWLIPYIGQMLVHRDIMSRNRKHNAITASNDATELGDRYRGVATVTMGG
jgi:hypothetical protein